MLENDEVVNNPKKIFNVEVNGVPFD